MTETATPDTQTAETSESFAFEAEISQLLRLLSHSLYQNKEIALRELISNASDALDKQRFAALKDSSAGDDAELSIRLAPTTGDDGPILRIADNGIGMTKDELVQNLGTIARSGSLEYLKQLAAEGKEAPPELIGQFGVGFYSSFMLADRVEVVTQARDGQAWRWTSDGSGRYEIEPAERDGRGTTIVLRLKDDTKQFADEPTLRSIVQKYSTYIAYPIYLVTEKAVEADDAVANDDDPAKRPASDETETVSERLNEQRPIWVEPKAQVTDEQHSAFYSHLARMPGEPLWRLHLSFDSPLQVNAIVYCPTVNFEAMGFGKYEQGLSLCAKRVLVQDDCGKLLPEYLRFLVGVVDSDDLPLNVSREALQDNTVFAKISRVLTKKVLDHIGSIADDEPETYATFLEQFGPILREGINDHAHRERVAGLLRFASSNAAGEVREEKTSLDAYGERMATGQEQIYFAIGGDAELLASNPQVTALTEHGLEVLLLDDPIDGFVMEMLGQWDGRRLVPVDAGDLELPELVQSKLDADQGEPPAGFDRVVSILTETLGERVKEVRASRRPSSAAAVLITPEDAPSAQMQRFMAAQDGSKPSPRTLELNPHHALVARLATLATNDDNRGTIEQIGRQLFYTAQLAAGLVPNMNELMSNSTDLLLEVANAKSSIVS